MQALTRREKNETRHLTPNHHRDRRPGDHRRQRAGQHLPFNGQETGAISDRFAIYFVPAGYVFSIWGLIYLGLIAYAIFQALPAQRENPRLRSIGGLFALASVANIAWIFLWHYEVFPATLAVMLVLLGSLIAIYLRLGTGLTQVSRAETWMVRVPFSVYLGWITVATVANATQLLYFLGWNGGALGRRYGR